MQPLQEITLTSKTPKGNTLIEKHGEVWIVKEFSVSTMRVLVENKNKNHLMWLSLPFDDDFDLNLVDERGKHR